MTSCSMVVVGGGLIAKSLADVDFGRPTLVLASGVSDSQEIRVEAFKREAKLVFDAIIDNPNLHIIYCSTCSVESGLQTPYIMHKLSIEKLIMAMAKSCHIFRLPQVVGMVSNKTLISYFVDSILQHRVLKIQTSATRNLLDVRDFVRVASIAVPLNAGVGVPQNIASTVRVPVIDIVNEIALLLGQVAKVESVDGGYSQSIDTTYIQQLLPADDALFSPDYWRIVLRRYVPLLAAHSIRNGSVS